MAYAQDEIIVELKKLLFQLKKNHDIKEAFLFGSHARGNPNRYSDVDIAIVLGTYRDGGPFDERFEIFHEIQRQNSLFEAVCFSEDEFKTGETTIVRRIKREGIKIV